jgi:hypothetical protein
VLFLVDEVTHHRHPMSLHSFTWAQSMHACPAAAAALVRPSHSAGVEWRSNTRNGQTSGCHIFSHLLLLPLPPLRPLVQPCSG